MPDLWGIAAILAKLLLYCGLTGATGLVMVCVAYPRLVAPFRKRIKTQIVILAGLGLGAALVGFMLRGAALTGGADGMVDPVMLGLLWQTPVGGALIYRIAGVAILVAGLFIPRFGLWISLLGGGIALWSFAQIGHVFSLQQTGVGLLLLLHLLGVAFWIGILAPLRALARAPEHIRKAASLGHQFGRAATVIVPVLILAGFLMAWLLLGELSALLSGYGRALMVKLALVGAVLALAAANKTRFVPAMRAGDPIAARHLARSIEIEAAAILIVLLVTATLTSVLTPPS